MKNEETPKTDHRVIGQALDLFSFHDVSPGAPFWHPKGMMIFRTLEEYARKINDENDYYEISTPILVRTRVFAQSGHWEHYRDNMISFQGADKEDPNAQYTLKPMNCPESTFIYSSTIRSYRDLPLRLAEIGRLHRNERSGTLGGLFRVKQITMDDAHIFVRPDQIEDEVVKIINIIEKFYGMFGFNPRYVLATKPESALGTSEDWERAESSLANGLKKKGIKYTEEKGGGAFYGPKIEVHMKDAQDRDWQMGTVQLDLVMLPKKFNLSYIDENGEKQMPWVIHRAIFGSFERFIGILLEHFNGALPFWLSPVQVQVLSVTDEAASYAQEVKEYLLKKNLRVELDQRNETIGKKIREAEIQKIPYLLIIGKKEMEAKSVAVRERGKGDKGVMSSEKFYDIIKANKI